MIVSWNWLNDLVPLKMTPAELVELLMMADDASALWESVLARGAKPCGLGARDTLRLEVCYPLHGNDIGPQWDPISGGLGWVFQRFGRR